MLEIFIVLNEKDKEKTKGRAVPRTPKGKRGGRKRKDTLVFFFFFLKDRKYLGCLPRSACLRSIARPLPPNGRQ